MSALSLGCFYVFWTKILLLFYSSLQLCRNNVFLRIAVEISGKRANICSLSSELSGQLFKTGLSDPSKTFVLFVK